MWPQHFWGYKWNSTEETKRSILSHKYHQWMTDTPFWHSLTFSAPTQITHPISGEHRWHLLSVPVCGHYNGISGVQMWIKSFMAVRKKPVCLSMEAKNSKRATLILIYMYMRYFIIYLNTSVCFGHSNLKKLTTLEPRYNAVFGVQGMVLRCEWNSIVGQCPKTRNPYIIAHDFGSIW